MTIGILFALKGGRFRAFYRWLKRDYNTLFGGLPHRTALQRQLREQQTHTDWLLAQPSVLNVADSYPIELLFPISEGRSKQQVGTKGKDKGRWSIGVKVCWIINTFGQVCGWIWDGMKCPIRRSSTFSKTMRSKPSSWPTGVFGVLKGPGQRQNLQERHLERLQMPVETTFSLLTVVCNAKKIFHRVEDYIEARLAYLAAMFNVLLQLFHQLHPDESIFKMSIAEFSL